MIDRVIVERLMQIPNVVAVGEGYKLVGGVDTRQKAAVASVRCKFPREMLNMVTDVVETGVIRALDADRTEYVRPVPGGVSCGHSNITAGTWGCLVVKDGKIYALSNNHVFANSNDAKIGDKIYQQGPYDIEGKITDEYLIAHLAEFVPIDFGDSPEPSPCPIARNIVKSLNAIAKAFRRESKIPPPVKIKDRHNLVDAAIARPVNLKSVVADILGIGMLAGVADVGLGDKVKKSGRTTGVTESTVTQINVTCQVQYGEGKMAVFEDQVMAGAMSRGGDSGSAVLDCGNKFVGLLFAGSGSVTIFSLAKNVFSELKLDGVV